MSTVLDAPSVEGQDNVRKAEWAKLNLMLEEKFYSDRLAFRLVAMLSKLYFVPEGKAVYTPTLWVWDEQVKSYCCAGKDRSGHDPYNRLVAPYDEKNRLVCDNGFNRHEWWQNAAFWWEATRALGLRRSKRHLNDLVEKKHTFWFRGHRRDILHAVQLDAAMAAQVNAIGIENGSVAPFVIGERTVLGHAGGAWSYDLTSPEPYEAKAGDWLCAEKMDSSVLYVFGEFPYNRARVFPQAFFAERARFIDEVY